MDEKAIKFGVTRATKNKENGQCCPIPCRKQSNEHKSLRSNSDLLYNIVITDYVFYATFLLEVAELGIKFLIKQKLKIS